MFADYFADFIDAADISHAEVQAREGARPPPSADCR